MKGKNIIYYFLIAASLLLFFQEARCQQNPLFSQYMFNGLVINPAYAGSQESLSLTGSFRKQWVGLEGSPSTQTLSAHAPFQKQKMAVGITLLNDYIGVTHQYGVNGIYAYRVQLSEHSKVSLGLQAGGTRFVARYSSLVTKDPNDPLFSSDASTAFVLNFGAGAYYYSRMFYAGISVPQILTNDFSGTAILSDMGKRRNYFINAGYVFTISRDLKFKPSTLIRVIEGAPLQADINGNLLIKEVLWIGGSFRTNRTMSIITQVQLTNQMTIGYSYDNSLHKYRTVLRGSHEFVLTYNFNFFGSKITSPRYF